VELLKYIRFIEILCSAIKAVQSQLGDNETHFKVVLVMIMKDINFILVSFNFS
jgi:hypothetical protein